MKALTTFTLLKVSHVKTPWAHVTDGSLCGRTEKFYSSPKQ